MTYILRYLTILRKSIYNIKFKKIFEILKEQLERLKTETSFLYISFDCVFIINVVARKHGTVFWSISSNNIVYNNNIPSRKIIVKSQQ